MTRQMTFSMSFSTGDVVLLPIPFTDLTNRKVRPVVVVGHSTFEGDLFVVPISSQLQNVDFSLADWQSEGLNVPCGVKSQLWSLEMILCRVLQIFRAYGAGGWASIRGLVGNACKVQAAAPPHHHWVRRPAGTPGRLGEASLPSLTIPAIPHFFALLERLERVNSYDSCPDRIVFVAEAAIYSGDEL